MSETVDPRDLSRGQQRDLQRGGPAFPDLAEQLAADVYGYDLERTRAEWWDVRHPSRPTKGEVKSTSSSIKSGPGRFRVFESQTKSLIRSDAQATAWYTFVLFDESAGVLRIRRMRPSTVNDLVQDLGGWGPSGHQSQGKQHKLPIDEVF